MKKTLAKLRERYVWDDMAKDVHKVVKVCVQCWRQNRDTTRKILLGSLPKGWPGEIIAMGLSGSLPRTKNGNVLVLVISDDFSKWVDLNL